AGGEGGRQSRSHEQIDLAVDQLGGEALHAAVVAVAPAELDREIAALDEAVLHQPLAGGGHDADFGAGALAAEIADDAHRRLRRSAKRSAGRRCAAEHGNELSSTHSCSSPELGP